MSRTANIQENKEEEHKEKITFLLLYGDISSDTTSP